MPAQPQTILIVEDEKGISDTVAYALKTEGFKPLVAGTGRQALQILKKDNVDLVILDLGLPDINGFDLFHEIRKTFPLPVIFLTARSEESDRVAGLEMGGDDFVTKPFKPRELSARVRAVLRRISPAAGQAKKGSIPEGSQLELDAEAYRAAFKGRPLTLSKYEFLILRALAEKPGRILSRDKILDLAWGEAEGPLDRTVDAHIKSLRAKFRALNLGPDPLRTHRGLGYSLSEDL